MSELGRLEQVASQPGSGVPATIGTDLISSAPSPRLVKAAHEFEAAMMKELMAPLVPGHDLLSGEEGAGSSSALGDFAGEALGKAISESGGFGIAKSIIHQLSRQSGDASNHSRNSPVPVILRRDTVPEAFK
jgi:Rod binding domain-containing protein